MYHRDANDSCERCSVTSPESQTNKETLDKMRKALTALSSTTDLKPEKSKRLEELETTYTHRTTLLQAPKGGPGANSPRRKSQGTMVQLWKDPTLDSKIRESRTSNVRITAVYSVYGTNNERVISETIPNAVPNQSLSVE
uniref:Uncharacterized protein n=1 Tax=Glossina pallidipes TaxID=7398 RepID=A0A1A9ZNW9_GLOPL